jgi:hypothetical protein
MDVYDESLRIFDSTVGLSVQGVIVEPIAFCGHSVIYSRSLGSAQSPEAGPQFRCAVIRSLCRFRKRSPITVKLHAQFANDTASELFSMEG